MKEDYQKALKIVISFFLLNPFPFNCQNYQKQKGFGTSDQSLFRLQNKFRKIPLLVMYYMTKFDNIYNLKRVLSYSKSYDTSLWHHKLFHFHLPFWTWAVWKGREKITKIWISENGKSFEDEIEKLRLSRSPPPMWPAHTFLLSHPMTIEVK